MYVDVFICQLHLTHLIILGLSTVPYIYTTSAVLLTVSNSMVAATSVYGSRWVVRDSIAWKRACGVEIHPKSWNRIWVVSSLLCNLRRYVCNIPYSPFPQLKDCILAKWISKGAYLNGGLTEELCMKQPIGFEVLEKFVDLSNPSICWISDVHTR